MKRLFHLFFVTVSAVTLLIVICIISCRKTEQKRIEIVSAIIDNNFSTTDNSPEIIKLVAAKVLKELQESRFIEGFTESAGKAYWNQAIVAVDQKKATDISVVTQRSGKKKAQAYVYIPFVKESEGRVAAILKAAIYEGDTVLKMLYPQQYLQYGFRVANDTAWNARDLFNIFSEFNYKLFGTERYIVSDGRIFGKDEKDMLLVTRQSISYENGRIINGGNTDLAKMVSFTVCNTVKACVYASPGVYDGGTCTTTTTCTSYSFDDGTVGSGNTTGSGSGGGPTNSNTALTTNPCAGNSIVARNDNRVVDQTTSTSASPCSTEPWQSANNYPCGKSFNFVKNTIDPTWQSAVVTDYFMILTNQATGGRGEFKLNIGSIQIGMPYKTYQNNLISSRSAVEMASIAGALAEMGVMNVMAINIRSNPLLNPQTINYNYYKTMFKEAYKMALDDLLREKFYDGQNVSPSRVSYDNFIVKDPSQYRKYDYSQDGCK